MDSMEFTDIIDTKVNEIIAHHGIKGQKWGIRRFQNPDGSYTAEGRKHYGFKTLSNVKERKQTYKNRKNMSDEELQKKIRRYQLEDQLYDEVIKAQKQYPFTYQQIQTITDEMLKNTRKVEQGASSGKKILKVFKRGGKNKKETQEKTVEEFMDELLEAMKEREDN